MPKPNKPLIERIRDRCWVDAESGCWIWRQGCSGTGYPIMRVAELSREPLLVRRVVYAIEIGPISPHERVSPRCGQKLCVSPQCLRAEKPATFNARLHEEGRFDGKAVHGGRIRARMVESGRAKLTPATASAIRLRAAGGEKTAALALEYRVCESTIRAAIAHKHWPESWPPRVA